MLPSGTNIKFRLGCPSYPDCRFIDYRVCRDSTLLTFHQIYVTQSFWSHKSIVLVLFSFLFIVLLIGTSRWAGASSSSLGHGPGISTKFKTSCSSNSIWSCKYDPVHSRNKNVTEIICFELQQQNFVILIAHHYRLDRLTSRSFRVWSLRAMVSFILDRFTVTSLKLPNKIHLVLKWKKLTFTTENILIRFYKSESL